MTFSKHLLLPLACALLIFGTGACTPETGQSDSKKWTRADSIVQSAIAYHGGPLYENLDLAFTFRNRDYTAIRKDGVYAYTMSYTDSTGTYERLLDNTGFSELLDGAPIILAAKDSTARAGTVNSVVYFALLPGLLNDPAVSKKYAGDDVIEGRNYHRIEVRFSPEGGGEDFSDVYLYWFDKEDYSLDYLAYSYNTDEQGTRFRKAVDSRRINGLVIQDYLNFRGPESPDQLTQILDLYKADSLELLSEIRLTRIKVAPVKPTVENTP